MNILLGDILLIFIRYSFSKLTSNEHLFFLVSRAYIYIENGIRPPFLFYKLGKFFLQVS